MIEAMQITIPEADLKDLHDRLDRTRWPEHGTGDAWAQGVPHDKLKALAAYWRHDYDWRRCEAWLNGSGQHRTRIDGLDVHFLHIPSPNPDALPLLITHGWPGSVVEFRKVIGPLTDPAAHGGDAADAFHLVLPSLPGFGFSGKPVAAGWGTKRIARAWATLMAELGYERYVAQGGDWGAAVTTQLGVDRPTGLLAIHLNMPLVLPTPLPAADTLSGEEAEMLQDLRRYAADEAGYSLLQSTRPQTLGYALADSPVGQAAWIYEKLRGWSDCGGEPENVFSLDEIIDNIMLYWLPNTGASSARLYWESYKDGFGARRLDLPVGCSIFPKELYRAPRSWAEQCMPQLIHWNELPRGGHFAAFEQPELFVAELRDCFRKIR